MVGNQNTDGLCGYPAASRRAWFLACAIVCFAVIAGNWALVAGRVAPQWDAADYFGPHLSLIADHIKAGHLVLWDPWVAGGNPDFAEPEFGTTSPLVLLIAFLSPNPQAGFVAYWLLIWVMGGLGMIFLTRHLGSPAWGSAVVSLGFISSGIYTGHAEHTSTIFSVSFLPWIIWRFDAALQRRRVWFAVQAGVLYGLSAVGGYPEFTILTPLFLGLWAFCQLVAKRGSGFSRAALMLFLTIAIGSVICSPSYFGFLKATVGYSDRVGPRAKQESIGSNILPAKALSTLASPYLPLLELSPNPLWPISGVSDVSMCSVYVGACMLAFALLSLRQASRFYWYLALVGLFFIFCSLGNQLPLRGWVYELLPPTRYFRNAALFRCYAILLVACFAARGVRKLVSSSTQTKERLFLAIGALLLACSAIATFAIVVIPTNKIIAGTAWRHFSFYDAAVIHLSVVWMGVVVLAALFKWNLISGRTFSTFCVSLALFDSLAAQRISRPIMYSDATIPWWHAINSEHKTSLDLGEAGLNRQRSAPTVVGVYPNNRNIPLRIPDLESYVAFNNRFHQRILSDPATSNMALGPNRMWFSAHPEWLAPSDANYEIFKKSMDSLPAPVLILHKRDQMLTITRKDSLIRSDDQPARSINSQAICSPAPISKVSYRPNYLTFNFRAMGAGWLLITDRWALDWSATVNGEPEDVFGADFIYRAVHVNAGENLIEFRYRPPFFVPLVVISWLALLVYLFAESVRIRRSYKR